MDLGIKKILIFIFSLIPLSILILFDQRATIIPEPFTITLNALSVAISYLAHDINGFLGLNEVYEILVSKIPHITNYFTYNELAEYIFDREKIDEINEYNKIITNAITESKNLIISDRSDALIYEANIGYIFFIITSFFLFGFNLKSMAILFLLIIFFSSIIFFINFYKNNFYFFLIQTLIFAITIIVIANFGGSLQTTSMVSLRFATILCVIPVVHLSLAFLNDSQLNIRTYIFAAIQIFLLIFIFLTRATSLWWGLLALIIFYLFWILKVGFKEFEKYKLNIISMIGVILVIVIGYNSANKLIYNNLADEYKKSSFNTSTRMPNLWHSLFVGVSVVPKIHEKYVCSDTKLQDAWNMEHIACDVYPLDYPEFSIFGKANKLSLMKDIFYYKVKDQHGMHAAIKYLRENGINEQLGTNHKHSHYWNLNWPLYEKILQKLYLDVVISEPKEFLYLTLIVRPLKFIFELVKSGFYFLHGFYLNFVFTFLIFFLSAIAYCYCFFKVALENREISTKKNNYFFSISSIFLSILFSIGSLSIFFEPTQQACIPDFNIIFISLILIYLKYKRIFEHR